MHGGLHGSPAVIVIALEELAKERYLVNHIPKDAQHIGAAFEVVMLVRHDS